MEMEPNYLHENDLSPQIKDRISAFSRISGVPVSYYSPGGQLVWECHRDKKICGHFDVYTNPTSSCRVSLASAGKLSSQLGEPYIFVCKAGFVKIAMPLIVGKSLHGFFLAGPLIMGELKKNTITSIFQLNSIDPSDYASLVLFLKEMKVFHPKDVSYLSSVFGDVILASVTPNPDYQQINTCFREQRKISENLQRYKKEQRIISYPYHLENKLLEDVATGNQEEAYRDLEELLLEMSIMEAGDISSVKTKLLSVCTILIRNSTEGSFISHELSDSLYDNLNAINEAASMEEIGGLIQSLIRALTENAGGSRYTGHSPLIRSSLQFINQHYPDKLSLTSVAATLHTNPSYLSMLFKKNLGMTFTEHLNQTRVGKSCSLLTSTTLSLSEIASRCGFEDQSYFSKVFKKQMGVSPKEYRKKPTL